MAKKARPIPDTVTVKCPNCCWPVECKATDDHLTLSTPTRVMKGRCDRKGCGLVKCYQYLENGILGKAGTIWGLYKE